MQVKTPAPMLLRSELREYKYVGLNWLVTLYNEQLNRILADKMGLGKTVKNLLLPTQLVKKLNISKFLSNIVGKFYLT